MNNKSNTVVMLAVVMGMAALALSSACKHAEAAGGSRPKAKSGFRTSIEDGRLWVLKDGEEKAEKHITLIGAGPMSMTIKAANKSTALEYIAAKPGFVTKADDEGRIWIFTADEEVSMPEKHVTRVGAGPRNITLKALNRDVLDAYCAAR